MNDLRAQLQRLSSELRAELRAHGFDEEAFLRLASDVSADPSNRNRLQGGVTPPNPDDLDTPSIEEKDGLEATGLQALSEGRVAFIVLAGGMATRMGGVVKALVPAVDDSTFLDLRIAEQQRWSERVGTTPPLWLMTSHATDEPLREALGNRVDGKNLALFRQNISLRLTPRGDLFLDEQQRPSLYATGHGDLPEALNRSDILEQFIETGGRYVWIANIDNLGAGLDPVLLGWHIRHGAPVSVEVVDKVGSDRGGIPVRWHDKPMILEEFRLPLDFDPQRVRVFNTNTFIVSAEALRTYDKPFTWVQVTKKVGNRSAIQFERLIGEITMYLPTKFVHVPRDGIESRFLPIKSMDELEARRESIRALARARGMLSGD